MGIPEIVSCSFASPRWTAVSCCIKAPLDRLLNNVSRADTPLYNLELSRLSPLVPLPRILSIHHEHGLLPRADFW